MAEPPVTVWMDHHPRSGSHLLRLPLFPSSIRWLAVLGVASVIFYFSIIAASPEQIAPKPEFLPLDKWRHFLGYGGFGYALAYVMVEWDLDRWRKVLIVLVVVALYGALMELGQSQLPARYFSIGDFIANEIGALLSVTWYALEPRVSFVSVSEFLSEWSAN